ncbi:MAG: phenylpyruvate tautomerase MIF-related protein [Oscillospiraceae bacterium]|nr:phenylpyruvate tautomerase MIF-related protein [Oscillospiraceae bacterium]
MPYIETVTNQMLPPESTDAIAKKLGAAIELIGKSENWLQLSFAGGAKMYFQGKEVPQVYARVALVGSASDSAYAKLTARICEIYGEELGVPPDKIYIQYEEARVWGWNGSNF